jgi:hypothetical protein
MDYEIRTDGLFDFTIRFRAIEEYRERILTAMDRAAHQAGMHMTSHVPVGETGRLFRAINVGPVVYMPGGLGGGGNYEIHVGVDEDVAPHALYVIEGTGEHHIEGGRGNIRPSNGNFMTIMKEGEGMIFRSSAEGQLPQTEWFEDAQELANRIIRREINRT